MQPQSWMITGLCALAQGQSNYMATFLCSSLGGCLQKIREYELQYEKSVQEMRELAILARKQIAAELRGRDNTPAGDYDEEGKKSPERNYASGRILVPFLQTCGHVLCN